MNYLRAITICSAFTPGRGYDNSTFIQIGDVYFPNTKCSGKFACTERLFNLSAVATINARNARLCCRCALFLLKIKRIPFSCHLVKGFTFFEESPKAIQDAIRDVYCPGKYCSNREKCESLDGCVTTPRSIYGCGKCGTWLFVLKVPFMLQEHVKRTKTNKIRFFFVKKNELGTQETIIFQ